MREISYCRFPCSSRCWTSSSSSRRARLESWLYSRENQAADEDIVAPLQQQGGPGAGGIVVGNHVEDHVGGDEQPAEAHQTGAAQIQVVISFRRLSKILKAKAYTRK